MAKSRRTRPLKARRNGGSKVFGNTGLLRLDAAYHAFPFRDISPNLTIKISERAKRMALRLDAKARVMHLVVPKRANLRNAYYFAKENGEWIRERLRELPRPVPFRNGSIIPVFGRNREIVVLYNKALKSTSIELKRHEIIVMTNKRDPSGRIRRFLMDLARQKITELADKKARRVRRRVASIQVRDTRSRWGSCSDEGHMSFSWRLIFAPTKALDYVVAHEVAHLVRMDHSNAFWEVCERLSKNFSEGHAWMQEQGQSLMRFGATDPTF